MNKKKGIAMMKMSLLVAASLLFLVGCSTRLPEEELRLPEEELRLAREQLDKILFKEGRLTQSEMTILSEYELTLACMERDLIQFRICNQPEYMKIEKQVIADSKRWNKILDEEYKSPSEYAGGSMEPMDRNLRMTARVLEQIDELKTKWLAEP